MGLFLACLLFLAVPAGKARAETIGVILTRGVQYYADINTELMKAVQSRREGIKFIIQRPYPDADSWGNAARKFTGSNVSAIITYGASPAEAVINEHPRVPVIYAGVYAPAAGPLKGKNVTGVRTSLPVASLMRYLRDIIKPGKMGIIYNSLEADSSMEFKEIASAAEKYGMKPAGLDLRNSPDATSLLAESSFSALCITGCSTVEPVYSKILMMMKERNIPVISLVYDRQRQPLISLYAAPEDQGRLAAGLLLSALKRASAKGVPAAESRQYFLIYNFRDSASMGLRTSLGLVTDATEVIY